jgi:ribosomal protein S18 acetylase RimI-like enzyme
MTGITLTTHDDVPSGDGAIVDAGLGEFNDGAAPLHEVHRLSCFARASGGEVVGGAIGRTWGGCAEIQQLWVAPGHRGRGIGSRLVRAFEERAAARGCRSFYLETFDFQAPAFYASLGYGTAFAFAVYPHGITKYTMVRELASDAPAR